LILIGSVELTEKFPDKVRAKEAQAARSFKLFQRGLALSLGRAVLHDRSTARS
jgi:hypothetical protein